MTPMSKDELQAILDRQLAALQRGDKEAAKAAMEEMRAYMEKAEAMMKAAP